MHPEDRAAPDGPELESLLRGAPLPSARPRFREACRERFLAQAGEPETPSQSGGAPRSPGGVEDAIERILGADPRLPQAREGFRDECQQRFLGAATGAEGAPAAELAGPRRRSRGRLIRFAAVAAGIAAALLVTILLPERPRWRVVELGGSGPVQVAGRPFDGSDRPELSQNLVRGVGLRSQEATVELALGDWLSMHVGSGTEMDFGRLEELETEGVLRLGLTRGEIFLSTTPGATPRGTTILIETADGLVEVTGTVLGVAVTEEGTCVCVARGSVVVHDRGAEAREPVQESSSFLFSSQPGAMAKRMPFGSVDDVEYERHTGRLSEYAGRP